VPTTREYSYDEYETWKAEKDFLMQEEGLSEEEADKQLENGDFLTFAWENFQEAWNELFEKTLDSHTGHYILSGRSLNWRGARCDEEVVDDSPAEILSKICSYNPCSIKVVCHVQQRWAEISWSHHDGCSYLEIQPMTKRWILDKMSGKPSREVDDELEHYGYATWG